jgi:hypothetical protein
MTRSAMKGHSLDALAGAWTKIREVPDGKPTHYNGVDYLSIQVPIHGPVPKRRQQRAIEAGHVADDIQRCGKGAVMEGRA